MQHDRIQYNTSKIVPQPFSHPNDSPWVISARSHSPSTTEMAVTLKC